MGHDITNTFTQSRGSHGPGTFGIDADTTIQASGSSGMCHHDLGTEQCHHHSHSHSSHKRAQAQSGKNQQVDSDPNGSTIIATREPSTTDQRPSLSLVEIAWSGDGLPWMVKGIPPEEAGDQDPLMVMGSSLVSTCLLRDLLSRSMYIEMVVCFLSLVSLDPSPMVMGDHLDPALEDVTDSDW